MPSIPEQVRSVFRAFETDGVAASGPHEPIKAEIISVIVGICTALQTLAITGAVTVSKASKANLDADLAHAAGELALVHSDSTATNNGIYKKNGASGSGSWSLVYQFDITQNAAIASIQAGVDANTLSIASLTKWSPKPLTSVGGTASAVTATATGIANPHQSDNVYQVTFPAELGSLPTLQINAGNIYDLRDRDGNRLLRPGVVLAGSIHLVAGFGTHYRLLTSTVTQEDVAAIPRNIGTATRNTDVPSATDYFDITLPDNPNKVADLGTRWSFRVPSSNVYGKPFLRITKQNGTVTAREIRTIDDRVIKAGVFLPGQRVDVVGEGGYFTTTSLPGISGVTIDDDDIDDLANLLADRFTPLPDFTQAVEGWQSTFASAGEAIEDARASVASGLAAAAPGWLGETGYATTVLLGDTVTANGALVPASWVVTNADQGAYVLVDGAVASASPQVVAEPIAHPLQPGRTYLGVWVVERENEGTNDGGDTVKAGLQYMKGDKTAVSGGGKREVYSGKPLVSQGRLTFAKLFSFEGTGVDYTIPTTARAARAYFEIYGNTPKTRVWFAGFRDVTDDLAGGADIAMLVDRLGAFEGTVSAAQDAIARVAELEEIIAGSASAPALDARLRPLEAETVPSLGYFGPDIKTAALSVARDGAGRLIEASFISGPNARRQKTSVYGRNVNARTRPSAGWASPKLRPISLLYVDRSGRPSRATLSDGKVARARASGIWVGEATAGRPSPSLGFLDAYPDSASITATVDGKGAVQSAFAAGLGGIALEFLRSPNGLSRREAPAPTDVTFRSTTQDTVTVPAARVPLTGGRWLYTRPATFACPAPATEVLSADPVMAGTTNVLRYADASWLKYQFLSGAIAITRTSGAGSPAAVSIPSQVTVDVDRGVTFGVDSGLGNYAATAAYTGHKVRADIVSVNPATGALTLTQGTEVPRCAAIRTPAVPAGDKPLFRIFSYRDGKEIIPLWPFERRVRIDQRARIEAEIAKNRARLARAGVFDKIVQRKIAGQPFILSLDGDSTSSRGGPTTADQPNGARDRAGYYQFYGAGELALLDTFDPSDGNGVMVREGPPWEAIKGLQRRGLTVTYYNWAIAGTALQSTTNHQTDPAKMARVAGASGSGHTDKKPDLLVFIPGQNDLGQTYVYERLSAYLAYMATQGVPVIVGTPCRRNPAYGGAASNRAAWLAVCADIIRACDDADVAYFDATRVLDDANLGAIGLSAFELSGASMQNHDEAHEQRARGDLVAELISA